MEKIPFTKEEILKQKMAEMAKYLYNELDMSLKMITICSHTQKKSSYISYAMEYGILLYLNTMLFDYLDTEIAEHYVDLLKRWETILDQQDKLLKGE